ncbi:ABC transporter permease [Paludibaculum fermentans]|uniref:ABC transporter permease n=1 Tax=Paludibaculum fermentans TaxID=1473598 RepID=A0A7S7NV29_PALFE|nr:ABC transporter permease [Paludibaculum fermentans]QOY90289.1 ABC transporter permease [Paludibaculum fermentans]
MINRLVFENLKHRKLRTALSCLSIGFQVSMILAVVGLSHGMLQDSINRAKGVGADIMIKPPGASAISLSGASMPEKFLKYFAARPHVTKVAGINVQAYAGLSTITGINLDEFAALSGGMKYLEGGPFKEKNDMIVDDWYAEQSKKKVGDTVNALNINWRICGIVPAGKLARQLVSLKQLQTVTNSDEKISQAFLKVDYKDNVAPVIAALKAVPELEGYGIYSIEEFVSLFSVNNVPALKGFIYVITGLSVIVGFLVVGLTMYTTVLERTREIGILKALGASPGDVMGILVRETLVLAVVGWICGILLSMAANWSINHFIRANMQSELAPDWWPTALGISLTAGLLGAVYPGMRAATQDAIEALSHE